MKNGFTLSEILITLGIIGVVFAITMPSVIQHFQKQKTVSQLKKIYTILNQAFKMSEIDNDSYENWDNIDENSRTEYVNKYWKPYLKVIKTCNGGKECGYTKDFPWINASNTTVVDKGVPVSTVILSNGILLMFSPKHIYLDLNASAGPNRFGHDLFRFEMTKTGIKPAAYMKNSIYCSKTETRQNNGEYCSGKIIYDGWKISDDYPW